MSLWNKVAGIGLGLTLLGSSVIAQDLPKGFEDYRQPRVIGDDIYFKYFKPDQRKELYAKLDEARGFLEAKPQESLGVRVLFDRIVNKLKISNGAHIHKFLDSGVVELYTYKEKNDRGTFDPSEHPFLYWFDKNKDTIPDRDEIYLDFSEDGFNGNELQ